VGNLQSATRHPGAALLTSAVESPATFGTLSVDGTVNRDVTSYNGVNARAGTHRRMACASVTRTRSRTGNLDLPSGHT